MGLLAYLLKIVGRKEPEEIPEPVVQEESGKVNYSPEELREQKQLLDSLTVKFEPNVLGDHLPVFGSPEEIIRINRDHPEYLSARRVDDQGCPVATDSDS